MRVRLLLFLLIVLIVIVVLFVSRCDRGGSLAADGCGPGTVAGECKARVGVGQLGFSVWSDGTLAIAIPVENRGGRGAGNVRVGKIDLGAGTRTAPVSLPAILGEIAPHRRAVVQATFGTVADPGNYTLAVSGTYEDRGTTQFFHALVPLRLRPRVSAPIPTVSAVVTKQHTTGTPLSPSPIRGESDDGNEVGPPLPRGEKLSPFPVAPKVTPVSQAPPPGGSAAGIRFDQDTGLSKGINFVPPDPSTVAASSASVVAETDNTGLQFSTDAGKTFTSVDPTTIFPASDGGICCDQVVLYDPNHDLVFWLQQYNAPTTAGGTNRLRIAWSKPASMKANINAWTYVDLTQPGYKSNGGLDYPDLALTNSYLYASVDGTDSTGNTSGLIVTRLSLSDIVGGGSSVALSYLGPNETKDQANAHGSHLTQDSADGMYWAGGTDTSHLEVFHWPDSAANVSTNVTAINTWCNSATDYANLPPDGMQWPDTGHLGGAGNVVAVTRKPGTGGGHGQVWFGWGAGADGTDCTQTGRPLPFVKIVQVDDTTLNSVGEYHIWNSAYAFSYPALGTDPSGNVGVSVAFAGPSNYPSSTVGYIGDYTVYYVEASDVSLKFYIVTKTQTFTFTNPGDGSLTSDSSGNPIVYTRYGDYFDVRNSGSGGNSFSSQGYAVKLNDATKSTTCLSTSGCTYHPHYEEWSRPTPTPAPTERPPR